MAVPGPSRARARSAENAAPRKPPRLDMAYPFRMSDMAWSSISIHRSHATIFGRDAANTRGSKVQCASARLALGVQSGENIWDQRTAHGNGTAFSAVAPSKQPVLAAY